MTVSQFVRLISAYSVPVVLLEGRREIPDEMASAARRFACLLAARSPRLRAKASYLLRDTLKVLGHGGRLAPPGTGFFYVNPEDAMAGGTGHTIRVCQQLGVPVILHKDWLEWMPELESGKWPVAARSYPRPKKQGSG